MACVEKPKIITNSTLQKNLVGPNSKPITTI